MGITDRMMIFADGRIVGEVSRSDYNQKDIYIWLWEVMIDGQQGIEDE